MKVDEPRFLKLAEVCICTMNLCSIGRFVRRSGTDWLNQPRGFGAKCVWYGHGNLFDIAAAYAFHVAESQAFVDGNKRTAPQPPFRF